MTSPESASTESPPPESEERENLAHTAGLRRVTMTTKTSGPKTTEPLTTIDPYIGATIDGRYLVEKVLGEGGMGIVYRCRHTIIDKLVAMKVLRADMARSEEVTERFLNEARSASSIGNPHIIDISDFGRLPDGATYFIMEYLDGVSLAGVVETEKVLAEARVLAIGHQIAEGLAAAHERGIVHRDLKPDNVFLQKRGAQTDFVKILDFGIAKAGASNSKLTQAGQVFGTPHYMSPEQASGSAVDHRSDIYSLGVILFELATGTLPFDAENFMAILTQHMYKEPPRPSAVASPAAPIGAELEAVILRCLAKSPEHRYASMAELIADLERIDAGLVPNAVGIRKSLADAEAAAASDRGPVSSRRGLGERRVGTPVFVAIGAAVFLGSFLYVFLDQRRKLEVAPAPPAVETPALARPTVVTPPPAPTTTQVAIAVAPLDAHVFRDGTDLGASPVLVEVGAEPLTLVARRDGYLDKKVVVDGADKTVSVTLEKPKAVTKTPASPPKSPPPPAPSKPTPKKKASSGDIVNPWD